MGTEQGASSEFGSQGSKLFSFKTLMKHKGMIPLAAMVTAAIPMYIAGAAYLFFTRDIVYIKGWKPVNERMDLLNPYHLKLMVVEQTLEKAEFLKEAYDAMAQKEKEEYKLINGEGKGRQLND